MKRIHRLRTTVEAAAVAEVLAQGRAAGLRIGWLDLAAGGPASDLGPSGSPDLPESVAGLDQAAAAGALRAVVVSGGRAVAVKRTTGPPTLRDLLREYFLGCAAVLVRVPPDATPKPAPSAPLDEAADLPWLEPVAGDDGSRFGWRVVPPDGPALALTAPELIARLRRPRPWTACS